MNKNMKNIKTGFAAAVLAGTGFASDAVTPVEPVQDSASLSYLSQRVETVMAKSGLQFGGEFESRGFAAPLSGNLIDSAMNASKSREDMMYTSLDLDMKVGPVAQVQGHASIRLHEDWRNMFGSYATPITMRWMSVDGNVKNMFFYSVGDFKDKFTKLTLWSPEPEIMYEPYIFARQRQNVMKEVFAGNNNRVLQGTDFAFRSKISPVFEELTVKGMATRTRWMGKQEDSNRPEAADAAGVKMDRYSAGANAFLKFRKDLEIGGTIIKTGDALNTHKGGSAVSSKEDLDQNLVFGGNLAVGTGLISALDTSVVNVRLEAEGALSRYYTYGLVVDGKDTTAEKYTQKGIASRTALVGKVGIADFAKITTDFGFVFNDAGFKNEMAQSPIFYNRQILNTGVKGAYNSFDGMYKSVFRYTPAEGELSIKEPTTKLAWTRGVMTADELAALDSLSLIGIADSAALAKQSPSASKVTLDRTFSPVMYYGDATPNRMGLDAEIGGDLMNKTILLTGKLAMLQTPKWYYFPKNENPYKSTFTQYGGGASIDAAKLGDWWSYPLIVSGSYLHTDMKVKGELASTKLDLVNSSLYWKFWKRAAVLGGAQIINKKSFDLNGAQSYSGMESNFAGGLEYTVSEGGTVSATVGKVNVKDNLNANDNFGVLQCDLLLTVKF